MHFNNHATNTQEVACHQVGRVKLGAEVERYQVDPGSALALAGQ